MSQPTCDIQSLNHGHGDHGDAAAAGEGGHEGVRRRQRARHGDRGRPRDHDHDKGPHQFSSPDTNTDQPHGRQIGEHMIRIRFYAC